MTGGAETPLPNRDLWIDMGLPSGTMWARRNIDVSQPDGFAVSDIQLDASYFSWGNVDGHNPNEGSFSPYDWGNISDREPYSTSPGASITYPGSMDAEHDCATVVCGAPWKVPASSDFVELINNCDYVDANGNVISEADKLITIDGVVGIRLRSKINGNILFFAACGYGTNSDLMDDSQQGVYWVSSLQGESTASRLFFRSIGVTLASPFGRFHGCTVRPIFVI